MDLAFAILFWCSAGLLAYVHVLFPLGLRLLAPVLRRPLPRGDRLPSVSVVVCASNEERHIAAKVQDCLRLDYPPDLIEILVVSDGSTDGTNAILRGITDARLRVLILPERGGKAHAQNVAVAEARHEVLFFTDATTMHPPGTLRLLVRDLADPTVGCVTGRPVFRTDEGAVSRGLETRASLEMGLRGALGEVYSLLGAQDCVYVVPRALYRPVRADLDSGFVGPLLVLEGGHRTVYEPEALAYVDRPPPDLRSEFERRSRIVLRGMRGVLHLGRLLNPFRHGFLAVALVSTRLLRWMTPIFLAGCLAGSAALAASPPYRSALVVQVLFYALALTGFLLARAGRRTGPLFSLPFYVCLLAASAAAGLWRLLSGETGQIWHTRR